MKKLIQLIYIDIKTIYYIYIKMNQNQQEYNRRWKQNHLEVFNELLRNVTIGFKFQNILEELVFMMNILKIGELRYIKEY